MEYMLTFHILNVYVDQTQPRQFKFTFKLTTTTKINLNYFRSIFHSDIMLLSNASSLIIIIRVVSQLRLPIPFSSLNSSCFYDLIGDQYYDVGPLFHISENQFNKRERY